MGTQSTALKRPEHRARFFVKTKVETARKQEPVKDQSIPPVPMNEPAATEEPAKRKLPLFMEPLFKAKEFDPL